MDEQFEQGSLGPDLRAELIRMLREDQDIQQVLREIIVTSAPLMHVEPEPEPEPEPKAVAPLSPYECLHDPLRDQLSAHLKLLAMLRADEELNRTWLAQNDSDNEGMQLARLFATAAQWERLLELWSVTAERCKSLSGPASAAELQILDGCLHIHNLIWRDRHAHLCNVTLGAAYDYRLHNRTSLRGEVITAQWLPGLINAGGELQCLPLVTTE